MDEFTTIPPEVAVLIPVMQLKATRENVREYSDCIIKLKTQLEKCPKIKETDNMKEHPAIFHYFCDGVDIYICEYDRKENMFGYAIIGGDLNNAEWGYFNLSELTGSPFLNIDYSFEKQSIESALYTAYPDYYPKPSSRSVFKKIISILAQCIKITVKNICHKGGFYGLS
jgi:hypothetical protein